MKSLGFGRGMRYKGVRGLKPYTTSNGEILMVLWTTLLYANSMWGKYSS